jgi:septum site-determining protein MinC
VATGNVVVLGALKGMAHAGAVGDEDSFILALQLVPTQLRIGRKIALPPERPNDSSLINPEIAFIREDEITLQPYRGRVR